MTSPYFKQTYTNFGCNNEDIFFIAIDLGDTDAQVIAYENTFLGGAPGYPSVSGLTGGGDAVVAAYGIGAFPTYILIQPDQTIIEQDMWPISNASTFSTYLGNHGLNPIPCTVGINEEQVALNASTVYPNPATDMLNIKSDVKIEEYRVFDMLGSEVLTGAISGQKNTAGQLDISSLKSGMYFLELVSEDNTGRVRFAKQ